MANYYELLKHPLWQKKRLLVLERESFCCEQCGSSEKTLHVHHTYYESKLKPWEYPDESLHALCEECHSEVQDRKALFDRQLGRIDYTNIDKLYGYALGIYAYHEPEAPVDLSRYEVASGLADYWNLDIDLVIDSLIEGTITGRKLFDLVTKHGAPQKPWLERVAKDPTVWGA